jgi:hypothetical protein
MFGADIIHTFYRLDAEWISAKKDWQNAQKRDKERRNSVAVPQEPTAERPEPNRPVLTDVVSEPPEGSQTSSASNSKGKTRDSAEYQPEMDEMRCILYAHGGTPTLSQDDCRLSTSQAAITLVVWTRSGELFLVEYDPATAYATLH